MSKDFKLTEQIIKKDEQGATFVQMGEWKGLTFGAYCKWGIVSGTTGPALAVVNDKNQLQVLIPVEAIKATLKMIGD